MTVQPKPLVSVIVPAYNAEKYVSATIASAMAQTYENVEVIVTDDGSTDGTATVIKDWVARDSRVVYLYQKNAGQSAARNTSLAAARGKYAAFLDADDLFLPKKIETQVAYLEAHPECGVSYCKIHHFLGSDQKTQYYFNVPHPSGHIFENLLKSNFINPLAVLLRRELLMAHGGFESTFRRMDEQYLWLKLAYRGVRFDYLAETLALYRIHAASLSNEPQYFYETEERFIDLLNTIKTWMTPEEARRYRIDEKITRCRRRYFIGRLMAMRGPLGMLLFFLYNQRRKNRLQKAPTIL